MCSKAGLDCLCTITQACLIITLSATSCCQQRCCSFNLPAVLSMHTQLLLLHTYMTRCAARQFGAKLALNLASCCRSAGVHWCPRVWPHHILPAFNFLAAGQEAKNHKLAFLGLLGMYHCWSHHHSFGSCWRAQRHHC